jgi:hypothetical protein
LEHRLRWGRQFRHRGHGTGRLRQRDQHGLSAVVVNNHGNSLNVTSPDLSQPLSGNPTLSITETDTQHFPAILPIYIDGTSANIAWTDHNYMNTENVTTHIDTTQFTNGPHELTMNTMSNDQSGGSYNYRAEYNRVIDIENGHTLMDVAANYFMVYVKPGGTAKLNCRDLFTDATSAPCASPTYSSNDRSVAVDASGNITTTPTEGFSISPD